MVNDVAFRGGSFECVQNFCGTLKDLDGRPLSHKFACRHKVIVEGQGHFV